jgi:hypothetical protein
MLPVFSNRKHSHIFDKGPHRRLLLNLVSGYAGIRFHVQADDLAADSAMSYVLRIDELSTFLKEEFPPNYFSLSNVAIRICSSLTSDK